MPTAGSMIQLRSCHVTLEDVAGTIKTAGAVKVEDAKTGEDVTAFILTQIVLEGDKHVMCCQGPSLFCH